MAQVIVVHGIGQQFKGARTMAAAVVPALLDGLRAASGPELGAEDVECVFYGDVYFEAGARDADLPPLDEYDVAEEELEAELLMRWWSAAAERFPEEIAGPDDPADRGALGVVVSRPLLSRKVRAALDALAGLPFFEKVADRALIFGLRQVRRYLTEEAIREAARARVAAAITDDTRVVVAHSLGSVVAYEALCAAGAAAAETASGDGDGTETGTLGGSPVTDFVTLGSPLGMRSIVFDRLDPAPADGIGAWPSGLARWTNIADPGDIVALPDRLRGRFHGPIEDRALTNGARMHDLGRYLTAPKTGDAIAAGLRGSG